MKLQPLNRLRTVLTVLRLRLRGDRPGRRFFVHSGLPRIEGRGRIAIAERVNWSCHGAPVAVEVGPGALLEIGDNCRIGPRCVLADTNHHPVHGGQSVRVAPVKLGRNVWLGRGVIVMPGVSIGNHAVIAAGSVVFCDVLSREVWRGKPAASVMPVPHQQSSGRVRQWN
ncbi:acyltransferase [Novosphingobium sp.]|uniref:acyltransferase n=1 Tax=Novosphingobium sp. TaxID=1874826 RepID=UPI00262256F9|nr:acyltransferase [Novosphingobium sp.]